VFKEEIDKSRGSRFERDFVEKICPGFLSVISDEGFFSEFQFF
jgi:hypothetical protein